MRDTVGPGGLFRTSGCTVLCRLRSVQIADQKQSSGRISFGHCSPAASAALGTIEAKAAYEQVLQQQPNQPACNHKRIPCQEARKQLSQQTALLTGCGQVRVLPAYPGSWRPCYSPAYERTSQQLPPETAAAQATATAGGRT